LGKNVWKQLTRWPQHLTGVAKPGYNRRAQQVKRPIRQAGCIFLWRYMKSVSGSRLAVIAAAAVALFTAAVLAAYTGVAVADDKAVPTPAATPQPVVPQADSPQDENPSLLTNPGLDGVYHKQCSLKGAPPWIAIACNPKAKDFDVSKIDLWETAQVPEGWSAWWLVPNSNLNDPNYFNTFPANCPDWGSTPPDCKAWHNPEYRDTAGGPQEHVPARKLAGDNSQKYFTFYSVHEAGIYQVVPGVRPGDTLRFSVWMEAWSTNGNDPRHSVGQESMGLQVGIDPYGGNNPWSSNIVWSPVMESYDQWSQFSVEATARADLVSVWTKSRPVYALQHNDVYVDEASLVVVNAGPARSSRSGTRVTSNRVVITTTVWSSECPEAVRCKKEITVTRTLPATTSTRSPTSTKPMTSTTSVAATTGVTSTGSSSLSAATTGLTSTQSISFTGDYYIVQKGDQLRAIAKRVGVSWLKLVELNPEIEPPEYVIYPGQKIRLR
jgi:LysM repeat protein